MTMKIYAKAEGGGGQPDCQVMVTVTLDKNWRRDIWQEAQLQWTEKRMTDQEREKPAWQLRTVPSS